MTDYHIKSRAHTCAACSEGLADGSVCVTALRANGEDLERYDYHRACWANAPRPWEPFSVWEGVYHAPKPRAQKATLHATPEDLLRQLLALEDPTKRDLCFLLAVMLERQKLLVERDVQGHTRIYEHRKTGETFIIEDPQLPLDRLESLQQQVLEMLI